jgi:hypothetical protein
MIELDEIVAVAALASLQQQLQQPDKINNSTEAVSTIFISPYQQNEQQDEQQQQQTTELLESANLAAAASLPSDQIFKSNSSHEQDGSISKSPLKQQQQKTTECGDENAKGEEVVSSQQSPLQSSSLQTVFDGTVVSGGAKTSEQEMGLLVRMCDSNLIPFLFETSLLRDESKVTAMLKLLPEYADTNSVFVAEYQGSVCLLNI